MSAIGRVAALGFFDGVHIGHAALMQRLLEVCSACGLKPAVVTFDTMPQNVLENKAVSLINSPEDKIWLIHRMFDIDDVIILPFNKTTVHTSGDDFIDRLIFQHNVRHFIAGYNFKYGKGAQCDSRSLQNKCSLNGLGCDIIPAVTFDGVVSSSTVIRELLLAGDIERANAFLGHPHVLTDVVRRGRKLGSKIGTPTINMRFAPGVLVPAHGVYATKVYIGQENDKQSVMLPDCGITGVTNIGVRPTVSKSKHISVETHIPGYSGNFYGSRVRVEFHKHLRPEIKFENIDELKKQIDIDCKSAITKTRNSY